MMMDSFATAWMGLLGGFQLSDRELSALSLKSSNPPIDMLSTEVFKAEFPDLRNRHHLAWCVFSLNLREESIDFLRSEQCQGLRNCSLWHHPWKRPSGASFRNVSNVSLLSFSAVDGHRYVAWEVLLPVKVLFFFKDMQRGRDLEAHIDSWRDHLKQQVSFWVCQVEFCHASILLISSHEFIETSKCPWSWEPVVVLARVFLTVVSPTSTIKVDVFPIGKSS